jgi:Icc-related predicted phosphoesterase
MKRFLLCAGVHGREKSLHWLQKLVEQRQPDGILFAGGVLDDRRQFCAKRGTVWGMTREDALFLDHFFETLGKMKVYTAIIPGPEDTPVEEFLRLGMHAEVEFPNLHLVHGTMVTEGNVAIVGIGGVLLEERIPECDCCSRTMAEYFLRPLWTARQAKRILLLPEAPPEMLGGTGGSSIAADFIDSFHPSLCVVKGSSDRPGQERIAHTQIISPGYLADGFAALLDWNRKTEDQVEFLSKQEEQALYSIETGAGD